jgi:hypothetical protein
MGLRAFVDAYQHGGNARVRQAGNQTALSAWGYNQVAQQANEQYVPALDSSAGCPRGADSSEHNNATAWVNASRHRQAAR